MVFKSSSLHWRDPIRTTSMAKILFVLWAWWSLSFLYIYRQNDGRYLIFHKFQPILSSNSSWAGSRAQDVEVGKLNSRKIEYGQQAAVNEFWRAHLSVVTALWRAQFEEEDMLLPASPAWVEIKSSKCMMTYELHKYSTRPSRRSTIRSRQRWSDFYLISNLCHHRNVTVTRRYCRGQITYWYKKHQSRNLSTIPWRVFDLLLPCLNPSQVAPQPSAGFLIASVDWS